MKLKVHHIMKSFQFDLYLDGNVTTDSMLNKLYESGFDDTTCSYHFAQCKMPHSCVSFDREGFDFDSVLSDSISNIESITKFRVFAFSRDNEE